MLFPLQRMIAANYSFTITSHLETRLLKFYHELEFSAIVKLITDKLKRSLVNFQPDLKRNFYCRMCVLQGVIKFEKQASIKIINSVLTFKNFQRPWNKMRVNWDLSKYVLLCLFISSTSLLFLREKQDDTLFLRWYETAEDSSVGFLSGKGF